MDVCLYGGGCFARVESLREEGAENEEAGCVFCYHGGLEIFPMQRLDGGELWILLGSNERCVPDLKEHRGCGGSPC